MKALKSFSQSFGLIVGIILGALFFGNYLAHSQVQQNVGVYGDFRSAVTTIPTWRSIHSNTADAQSIPSRFGGGAGTPLSRFGLETIGLNFVIAGDIGEAAQCANTEPHTWNNIRAAYKDAMDCYGIASSGNMVFNGTFWDRARSIAVGDGASTGIPASGLFGFNGTTFDRLRTTLTTGATQNIGTLASHSFLLDTSGATGGVSDQLVPTISSKIGVDGSIGTNFGTVSIRGFNGSATVGYDRLRTASATNLTATTSAGTQLTTPLSTWSVTNTPAAATQATASRAAGAAGVRHVATTITACYSGTVSGAPIQVNLRDGATGAGTVLRSWLLAFPSINDGRCVDLSGLAMTGTAATAMTIEFAAAGAANTNQTVTLTGYSVN